MHPRLVAALILALLCRPALAQPKPPDPDWPCQQVLVPRLAAGSYWTGPKVPTGDTDWHNDQPLSDLVTTVTDRNTQDNDAVAALHAYIARIPHARRSTQIPRLFGIILDEINDARSDVIEHIKQLGRRQRNLDATIDGISKQIEALPAGDQESQRTDLTGQRDFNIRTFQETQHTMRYACEVPGTYDHRIGTLARVLQGGLEK